MRLPQVPVNTPPKIMQALLSDDPADWQIALVDLAVYEGVVSNGFSVCFHDDDTQH